jgi:short-subunit dehydrogenase
MEFKNKTALVTGSSGGIGAAVAIALAKEGADVVLASRNLENMEQVKLKIETIGRKAVAIECDVSRDKSVVEMKDKALKAFKNIDILINNAGVGIRGFVEDIGMKDWNYIFNTNMLGYVRNIEAFLPHFEKRGSGYIVNVSSIQALGYSPEPLNIAYIATKGGIVAFTTAIHSYLKPRGIKVSCLIPGAVNTEISNNSRFVGSPEHIKQMKDDAAEFWKLPIFLTPAQEADGLIAGIKKEEFLILVPENMKQNLKAQGWDIDAYNSYVANPPPVRRGPQPEK